jgi:signal transduction histidine kinase
VSHELRAPIGSIRLMAEALHDGKVAGGAAREFHRLIAGESARLSQMVENVLDFARIEEGRKRYQFEETDLQQLAADTLRLLAPLAAERGITLVPELSCVTATVDPAAIQQALVNLLDNAIKFSPEGGTVTVGLEEAAPALPQDAEGSTRDACGPRWVLSVRDQGPGIPPAERERIFERFYRLGNELRRETQGAGIGLSIVKHIAEGHGGRVAVCEGEGGLGSVFTIKTQDCKTQDARLEQA